MIQRRKRWLAICGFALILMARPGAAQSLCQPTESVNACIERLTGELGGGGQKAAAAQGQTDVKKKTETGLADINGLSSSVKDFLPLLQLTGVLGAVTTDDAAGTVSVALNTPFLGASGKLTEDPSFQLKGVIETKGKLFDELRKRLPADKRDSVEKALLRSKTDAENATLHASYNFTSRRLGRNFARHMTLYNDLFEEAVAGPTIALVKVEAKAIKDLIDALPSTVSLDDTRWVEIPEENRAKAQIIILQTVDAHLALQRAFAAAVRSSGLDLFGQLINNQPQLTVTVTRSFRDDLYGPDLSTGRITFEMGLGNNLNGFFDRFDPRQCRDKRAQCLAEYSGFVAEGDTRANIKAGSRLSLYAEFIQHAAYAYANPGVGLDVAFDEGTTFNAGFDYGRLFGVNDAGVADGRLDASLSFEHSTEAPDDTRFVTSVTITKKLGEISIPFGIVYANKPRYLTGVDKGLSANVGLKFNLFPGVK